MIRFFTGPSREVYAIETSAGFSESTIEKLSWILNGATFLDEELVRGPFIGPRKEMVTPWSTNAVEITQNMGVDGISRMELFYPMDQEMDHDPMLQAVYDDLGQDVFFVDRKPGEILEIHDIAAYNNAEGLALSEDEVVYLETVSQRLGRPLTDSEVFGFSQVNSEHCRHKIFNGSFIIDGKEMPDSLFSLIKRTSRENPNFIVSAYKDNVAFIQGPESLLFSPLRQDIADWFGVRKVPTVISLKAETHNFPTTVEPFNGAATGSGGEIRDRMAGGQGSFPMAGTAVYMTSYSRLERGRRWESHTSPRPWLYQDPGSILLKASDGASDFGNKFGQPLICGSLLTYEQTLGEKIYAYDKVIMLAGGIGFGHRGQSLKKAPQKGDHVVVLGGDNYRIGMGGGAVSSVATGQFGQSIELNAVQRSNPEMQKRVYNAIRALSEQEHNPIISVHDHGAGGHLNSLSELVEESGGEIDLRKLPVGDPTLSAKEIIGNESQERMGLVLKKEDLQQLKAIAKRERAPMYDVGIVTGNQRFVVKDAKAGKAPIDLHLADMFGKPPQTVLEDIRRPLELKEIVIDEDKVEDYLVDVLQQESVACKDWLTNKVDRSVSGRVAMQQTCGAMQLPLNDFGLVTLDMTGESGIATSIGHAPAISLIDPAAGSRIAVAEALTNISLAPLKHGLKGVSLSANWMWPARQEGENARLYDAVEGISDFVVRLGINIPTGKDSLSMTQRYPDGKQVLSPGTVIVSAAAETANVRGALTASLVAEVNSSLVYIPFSKDEMQLGGTVLAQSLGVTGTRAADVSQPGYLAKAFESVQQIIREDLALAGHDVSEGGLVTCLLEMLFPTPGLGIGVDSSDMDVSSVVQVMFAEHPAVVIQTNDPEKVLNLLEEKDLDACIIAKVSPGDELRWKHQEHDFHWKVDELRRTWFRTSYLLDKKQSGPVHARKRYENLTLQKLSYVFPQGFTGRLGQFGGSHSRRERSGICAAIIREKGVNGDREMAYALWLAGFDVKDIHMTDLISGREDLSDIRFIVFVGGFSNSDVLGSARGWAGAFMYNEKAKIALDRFYAREDTLSLGVCNGCQLMMALGIIRMPDKSVVNMKHNASGKFESAFLNVEIPQNNTVMLKDFAGSRLGIWVAHGEGRFELPGREEDHNIAMKYSYMDYPGNPNGSNFGTAALATPDGRHLAMMPHLERAFLPWQWADYPADRKEDQVSPWIHAFVNAKEWLEDRE